MDSKYEYFEKLSYLTNKLEDEILKEKFASFPEVMQNIDYLHPSCDATIIPLKKLCKEALFFKEIFNSNEIHTLYFIISNKYLSANDITYEMCDILYEIGEKLVKFFSTKHTIDDMIDQISAVYNDYKFNFNSTDEIEMTL